MIPLSDKPLEYRDEKSGMIYELKQPTDTVLFDLADIDETFPADSKERAELFTKNRRERLRWVDEYVNAILTGWRREKGKCPAFPTNGNPSAQLRQEQKYAIIEHFMQSINLTDDEVKNS